MTNVLPPGVAGGSWVVSDRAAVGACSARRGPEAAMEEEQKHGGAWAAFGSAAGGKRNSELISPALPVSKENDPML